MSILRRYFQPNQICFITSVTFERKPILIENIDLFQNSIARVRADQPFELYAWVLMPDHLHLLLSSPRGDFSTLLKRIKLSFAYQYRQRHRLHSGTVWQARFWDHVIRDERDLATHADYIHYNPVKHAHVSDPGEWKHSSIHEYQVDSGLRTEWSEIDKLNGSDFGE